MAHGVASTRRPTPTWMSSLKQGWIFRYLSKMRNALVLPKSSNKGLTLVHFSAQPEPFLTQNTPFNPNNIPQHHLRSPIQPLNAPLIP